jgi:hypothetical protein
MPARGMGPSWLCAPNNDWRGMLIGALIGRGTDYLSQDGWGGRLAIGIQGTIAHYRHSPVAKEEMFVAVL